jgi:hypothetical protein
MQGAPKESRGSCLDRCEVLQMRGVVSAKERRIAPEFPGADLLWRRVLRLRGPMPIEVLSGIEVIGRIEATDALGRTCRATAAGITWEFATTGVVRKTCVARNSRDTPVAVATRSGFRRRRVGLASGAIFECRQSGMTGRFYEVFCRSGDVVLTALNSGGALRWHGSVRVCAAATKFADDVPLLTLFLIFLVFTSHELSL